MRAGVANRYCGTVAVRRGMVNPTHRKGRDEWGTRLTGGDARLSILFCGILHNLLNCLLDSLQRCFLPQHFQRLK